MQYHYNNHNVILKETFYLIKIKLIVLLFHFTVIVQSDWFSQGNEVRIRAYEL